MLPFPSLGIEQYLLHKLTSLTPIKSHKRAAEKKVSLNTPRKLSALKHKMLPAKASSVASVVLIKVMGKSGIEKKIHP
jgi:hypothetical protein